MEELTSPAQFFDYPVYNSALSGERRIINLNHIEQVRPHANVPVDSVDTPCVEIDFYSGTSIVVLLDLATVKTGLNAFYGVVDANGTLS